jgi:trigger factor
LRAEHRQGNNDDALNNGETMQVRSEMKTTSTVERELSVVVPGDVVAKELDRAYRELSMKVKLKGFRPGKIPRYVLEQYYKADTEQQVLERVVRLSFAEASKSHALEPVANPSIEPKAALISGMDFSYNAKVEVKPAITVQVWKGLELQQTTYTAGDSDVQKELERLREAQARVAPVEGRTTVQQGDFVDIDWSGTVDGDHVKGLSGVSYTVEIGGSAFPYKDAEQALVGKSVGDKVTAQQTLPEAFPVAAQRGKTAAFTMSILRIKQKTLPNLDDEFAKDVGDDITSLAQLKERILEQLTAMAERKTKGELQDQAVTALIEKNPFDVPPALVARRAEEMVAERLQRMPEKQAEMMWQVQGERLKNEAKPQAERQVRISLLLEQLCKDESVSTTEAELEAHYEKLAADFNANVKTVKSVYAKNNRGAGLSFELMTQKMIDRVIGEAKKTPATKSITA